MKTFSRLFLLPLVCALALGCSSTKLISSWAKEGTVPKQYKKVLVFAIAAKTSNRAMVEMAMVDEFKAAGVQAVSSIFIFPFSENVTPDQIKAIPKEDIAQKLKDNGLDGLLILSLLDKKEEEVYVQGATYTQPVAVYNPAYYSRYAPYYGSYYNYYSSVYTTVTLPGYYDKQTSYFLESNFYNVEDESLVWSGQTKAVDPSDIHKGVADWAELVVNELKTKKVLF